MFDVFLCNMRICKEKKEIEALFDAADVIIVGWNLINWIRFMGHESLESFKLWMRKSMLVRVEFTEKIEGNEENQTEFN